MKKRNPDAMANFAAGRAAFLEGYEDPEAVFRRYLETAAGAASARHWATGYRDAAAEARAPLADSLALVLARRETLPLPQRLRLVEIMIETAGPRVSPEILEERDRLVSSRSLSCRSLS